MYIRSQDKALLLNLNNLEGIYVSPYGKGFCVQTISENPENAPIVLARYSTYGKALRAMDMTSDAIIGTVSVGAGADVTGVRSEAKAIFQMPSEKEVNM